MKYILVVFALFICLSSCKRTHDNDYFRGDIVITNDLDKIEAIEPSNVILNGVYSGSFFVEDTLMFFMPGNLNDKNYIVFNIKTGEELGRFISKGRGANEFTAVSGLDMIYNEDGCIKAALYAPNERRMAFWNVSESLDKGITVYDSVIPFDWEVDGHRSIFNSFYDLVDTLILFFPKGRLTASGDIYSLPRFEWRTKDNRLIKADSLFTKFLDVEQTDKNLNPRDFINYSFSMKEDKNKIIFTHRAVNQITILDTKSGNFTGYRIEGSPAFTDLNGERSNFKYFNTGRVTSDNNYIYSLHAEGENSAKFLKDYAFNMVYVYNWDGRLVKKIDLKQKVTDIKLDKRNRILYGQGDKTDSLFYWNLNELNWNEK